MTRTGRIFFSKNSSCSGGGSSASKGTQARRPRTLSSLMAEISGRMKGWGRR
ncbi:MAG TPA: hypothetical protein DCG12_21475 [Planctomycetaceae bacterium]|nr:hypothetical protein [Planctomycetaceae bacterium]